MDCVGMKEPSRDHKSRSLENKINEITSSQLYKMTYVAVPLFVLGGITYKEEPLFRDLRNHYIPRFRYHYDDYLQYIPSVAAIGLKAAGVESKSSWGRMLTANAFSAVLMASMVNGLKGVIDKRRPDGSDYNSFPSGHTATAFMGATVIHKEYGLTRSPWYSIGAYSMATATALSRQLNNKHWFSDVLFGAGIGILSVELGYYLTGLIFKDKGLVLKDLSYDTDNVLSKPSFIGLRMGFNQYLGNIPPVENLKLNIEEGANVSFEGAYFLNRYVGVGGMLSLINVPFEVDNAYYRAHSDLGTSVRGIDVASLDILSAFSGVYFSYPVFSHWLLGANFMGGCNWTHPFSVQVSYDDMKGSVLSRKLLSAKSSTSPGLKTGISIMKVVNDNFGIRLYCDYQYSSTLYECKYWDNGLTRDYSIRKNGSFITAGLSANVLFW